MNTVPTAASGPRPPRLDFLCEARVKLGEFTVMGRYADGRKRGTLHLLGGTFEGPAIRGTILPSTKDWPVYYGDGVRRTDVDYVYLTDDGAHLFVSVRGYRYEPAEMSGSALSAEQVVPAPNLLRVFVEIQAPEDSQYAWLSRNLFLGVGGSGGMSGDRTAILRLYRLL